MSADTSSIIDPRFHQSPKAIQSLLTATASHKTASHIQSPSQTPLAHHPLNLDSASTDGCSTASDAIISVHSPLTWTLPPESALYATFHAFLAADLIVSPMRHLYKGCFCDYVLEHIKTLMYPLDIGRDCPSDSFDLRRTLEYMFSERVADEVKDEIYAPINRVLEDINGAPVGLHAVIHGINADNIRDFDANLAAKTQAEHLRPHITRVVCVPMKEKAYEEAEKAAMAAKPITVVETEGFVRRVGKVGRRLQNIGHRQRRYFGSERNNERNNEENNQLHARTGKSDKGPSLEA